jgi:hypothetical protein
MILIFQKNYKLFIKIILDNALIFSKKEPKRSFSKNKSTLILVIVLVLVFRYFLDKKDRLGKSTKNGRLKG